MTLLVSVRDWLRANNLDAVMISSRANKQPHMQISSGSGYVVISRTQAHILLDFRYYAEVAAKAQGYQLHLLDNHHRFTDVINTLIAEEGWRTLGFEGVQVSWHNAEQWRNDLHTTLRSISLDSLRQIKTTDEIASVRAACAIADRSAEYIRQFIQPGMREREVAAELEWYMKTLGADKPSFDTIVASGPRGALPHGKASEKVIVAGEMVTLDFGAQYGGYCSDMTRTFLVHGRYVTPSDSPLYHIYHTVLQAQLAAIAAIKPGVLCQSVDAAARKVIKNAGYGDFFGHNTGHGLGIEVHESPYFSPQDFTPLEAGMLLTVEPGIYLPDAGGVRIEDVVLVTPQGAEVLYRMPKTLLLTGEQ